jgi:hypothetical protein
MTALELISVGLTMLAMLRWTKTSPGCRPRTVVSGMRESEQPSQRIVGVCPVASVGKKEGFWCDL